MSNLPPECEQLLISGYVLGNLSPAEAMLFEEMLAEDPSLQERVIEMQSALELAFNPSEIAPPSALRDRILNAASAEAISNPENISSNEKSSIWNKILSVTAIGTIAVLGWSNYRLWQKLKLDGGLNASKDRITYALESSSINTNPTVELIVDSCCLSGTLRVNDLPALPPDKAYALWTVVGQNVPYTTDDKGAILTAVFQVAEESGNFTQQIALPQPHLEPRIIKKLAITIEDVAAPQAHQGDVLFSTEE